MYRAAKLTVTLALTITLALPVLGERDSAIEAVVEKYLIGASTGQRALVEDTVLSERAIPEAGGAGSAAGSVLPRGSRVVDIDATDDAALVTVEIEWKDRLYTDQLVLVKVDGQWKITNKIMTWENHHG